ncbi:MAG: hypothetical protein LBT20_04125 [Clostridiales bacterium]|jgi:hypothetical protein|nr:hypothetical protein [Clostridiales bacterium]
MKKIIKIIAWTAVVCILGLITYAIVKYGYPDRPPYNPETPIYTEQQLTSSFEFEPEYNGEYQFIPIERSSGWTVPTGEYNFKIAENRDGEEVVLCDGDQNNSIYLFAGQKYQVTAVTKTAWGRNTISQLLLYPILFKKVDSIALHLEAGEKITFRYEDSIKHSARRFSCDSPNVNIVKMDDLYRSYDLDYSCEVGGKSIEILFESYIYFMVILENIGDTAVDFSFAVKPVEELQDGMEFDPTQERQYFRLEAPCSGVYRLIIDTEYTELSVKIFHGAEDKTEYFTIESGDGILTIELEYITIVPPEYSSNTAYYICIQESGEPTDEILKFHLIYVSQVPQI